MMLILRVLISSYLFGVILSAAGLASCWRSFDEAGEDDEVSSIKSALYCIFLWPIVLFDMVRHHDPE